jgi:hypothetical protein
MHGTHIKLTVCISIYCSYGHIIAITVTTNMYNHEVKELTIEDFKNLERL